MTDLHNDLARLARMARRDRRITTTLLALVAGAWIRQLGFGDALSGEGPIAALSAGLAIASMVAWAWAAFFVGQAGSGRGDPADGLLWAARIQRAKEWAAGSFAAYLGWHTLNFVAALIGQ